MKLNFLVLLTLLMVFISSCGPTIYMASNFDSVKSNHKQLAILPFDVLITAKKLPKDMTAEMVNDEQKKTGLSIQNHSYTYFLKEMSKNKYTVTFQDIDKTNALLSKSGITYEKLNENSKEELCKILGVDAIISGKVTMDRPMSEGGAVALGLVFGVWTATNKVNVSMTIHDKTNSDLLWKYDWVAEGSIGSNSEQLTKGLMKNVSKNFPYKRK